MCVIAKIAYVNSYYLAANTVLFIECVVALLSWPVVGHLGTHLSIRWAVSSLIVRRTRLSTVSHQEFPVTGPTWHYLEQSASARHPIILSNSLRSTSEDLPLLIGASPRLCHSCAHAVTLSLCILSLSSPHYSTAHLLPACRVRCSAQIGSSTWLREIPRISVAPYHVFLRVHDTTTLLLVTFAKYSPI